MKQSYHNETQNTSLQEDEEEEEKRQSKRKKKNMLNPVVRHWGGGDGMGAQRASLCIIKSLAKVQKLRSSPAKREWWQE